MALSESEVDAAFHEVGERHRQRSEHQQARRELWLAHHWPDRYDRCIVIAGRHVCRRCVWFYGIAFFVAALAFVGVSPWPEAFDVWAVWILPLPATLEFFAGELGLADYDARRQIAVTALMSPAVGRGMAAELSDRGSWLFWGPVLVFGTSWFVIAVIGWRRKSGQYTALGS